MRLAARVFGSHAVFVIGKLIAVLSQYEIAPEGQLPMSNLRSCWWFRAALAIRHDENVSNITD